MSVIYGLIPALIFFLQGFGFKTYALRGGNVKAKEIEFNCFNFFLTFLISLPFAFASGKADWHALLWGLLNGVMLFSMVMLYSTATRLGKISFNNFVMALAMLFPIVFFAVSGKETIGTLQYVGLGTVVVACFLVSFGQNSKDTQKTTPKLAYVLVICALFLSGAISILAKHFPATYEDFDKMQYMSSSFFCGLVLSTVGNGVFTRFKNTKVLFSDKWFVICLAIVVVGTAFGNLSFMYFAEMANSAVFFPICNGFPMILTALLSPFFKEKISLMTWIGIIFGVSAMVLLNL